MKQLHLNLTLHRPDFSLQLDTQLPLQGIMAVYGASGSGKTTLLRCVAGLEQSAQGRVCLDDEIWQDTAQQKFVPTHQRALGYVFQEASLFDHLSVQGNLDFATQRAHLTRGPSSEQTLSAKQVLAQAIELLGIGHLLKRAPLSLSGGERQRVAIARAMATQPRLLLLDEPLASLDATRRQEIMPWLERLRDELHLPMLYVTHAADEVARLSQTLLIMAQGQLKACGATVQTLNREWFAMHGAESAAALFDATVVALDPTWHLALVQCSGMALWLRDTGFRVGQSVRVSLNADDVSLTLEAAKETSIQNHVPVEVVSLQPDTHPAHVWIHLRAQESNLWARLTARSVYELALTPGMRVWAQIKSVALVK